MTTGGILTVLGHTGMDTEVDTEMEATTVGTTTMAMVVMEEWDDTTMVLTEGTIVVITMADMAATDLIMM